MGFDCSLFVGCVFCLQLFFVVGFACGFFVGCAFFESFCLTKNALLTDVVLLSFCESRNYFCVLQSFVLQSKRIIFGTAKIKMLRFARLARLFVRFACSFFWLCFLRKLLFDKKRIVDRRGIVEFLRKSRLLCSVRRFVAKLCLRLVAVFYCGISAHTIYQSNLRRAK